MMIHTLHIFNPEHDIALAVDLANFTAPHAGRQLRGDLGFLPALWAEEGDAVLVDNARYAELRYRRLRQRLGRGECRFVEASELASLQVERIAPWGWDRTLTSLLRRKGIHDDVLPTDAMLDEVRQLSHRRTSAHLLQQLQMEGCVGESVECSSLEQVARQIERHHTVVLKAPWSSSGRGVRFITGELAQSTDYRWLQNVIERQGSVMVEPYYNKVKDFGMEFEATDSGIRYVGLSLFQTKNGAYTGNVLATEHAKREVLARYVSLDLLDAVRERIVNTLTLGSYRGPFGIDMMLVNVHSLHPCVEINLRRTMGHVALSLEKLCNPTQDDDIRQVMRVIYNGTNYQLKILKR